MRPIPGMLFVIEDVKDNLKAYEALVREGFVQSDAHRQNVGVAGVVLRAGANEHGIQEGDHILYSQFTAEQLFVPGADGQPIKNLRSVPADSVLGFLD